MKRNTVLGTRNRLALWVVIAAALVVTVSGCASTKSNSSNSQTTAANNGSAGGSASTSSFKVCYAVDVGGIHDGQYYQVAYDALIKLKSQIGIEVSYLVASGAQDYVPMINTFVKQKNCSLIYALGSVFASAVQSAAQSNPNQKFLMEDAEFTDKSGKVVTYPNVENIVFKNNEASFMPGYIAAAMTKTGIVGEWGGQPNPQVQDHMIGFEAGVDYYNQQNQKNVKVLGWDTKTMKGSFTGSFADQQAGYSLTSQQISQGADIIFSAGGQSDLGKAAAAKDHPGTLIIWVVNDPCESADQVKSICPLVLTSSLVHVDVPVTQIVTDAAHGVFKSGVQTYGLASGAVGPAPFHQVKVPASVQSEIDATLALAKAGKITVPSAPGAS
jgi:basic membrane protein A